MFKSLLTIFFLSLLFITDIFIADALAQNAAGNPGWWKGVETEPFAGGVIRDAYCDIISYMEGSLGGMLMAAAGIMAMAVAALGDFKHAATAVAVGIATVCISTVVGLFFGQLCGGGQQKRAIANTGIARTAIENTIDAPDIDFEVETEKDPFDL